MSGTSRPPDEDRNFGRPSTTGRHHALPDHWHGVLTSPGEWGRIHVGDLLVAAGLVVLPFGLLGVILGSQSALATAFGLGCTLAGVGVLLAPDERMRQVDERRRDPHRSDPAKRYSPGSTAEIVLSGFVLLGAGIALLGVGLRG